MPKRGAIALVTTALAVVLLFTFKPADQVSGLPGVPNLGAGNPVGIPTSRPVAGAQPRPTPRPAATSAGGTTASAAPGATAQPDPPAPTDTPAPGGGATGTYTGDAIDTPYGTVQIAIVVQGGRITDVRELQLPRDRQLSAQISAYAGPRLRAQVIQAQGDNITGVSGASYTSYGFYQSLQSALAQE